MSACHMTWNGRKDYPNRDLETACKGDESSRHGSTWLEMRRPIFLVIGVSNAH
jgi:hypothetical protein